MKILRKLGMLSLFLASFSSTLKAEGIRDEQIRQMLQHLQQPQIREEDWQRIVRSLRTDEIINLLRQQELSEIQRQRLEQLLRLQNRDLQRQEMDVERGEVNGMAIELQERNLRGLRAHSHDQSPEFRQLLEEYEGAVNQLRQEGMRLRRIDPEELLTMTPEQMNRDFDRYLQECNRLFSEINQRRS